MSHAIQSAIASLRAAECDGSRRKYRSGLALIQHKSSRNAGKRLYDVRFPSCFNLFGISRKGPKCTTN